MSISYAPWNQPVTIADRVCLRDGDAELSYGHVARRTEAVAERFAALGVRRGDVVAIMLPNCAQLLLGLLAAWRLGAAATPVNPAFTANEAARQIQDSDAALLLTSTADADYGVPVVLAKDLAGHDAVLEVAVVGAPHPVYGEGPVAYVVTYPGTSVTTAELTDRCRRDLTKIKIPVAIHLVERLPKNAVGKIDKPALRKTLSRQSA
jgi:acyl-CoA synthetase (AMP-forming)/AMP-acid ligase II